MTDAAATPWKAAAVLVWGPAGAAPDLAALSEPYVQGPPRPNPAPFWRFADAVEHAGETIENGRHANKEPWIKSGETLYSPIEIAGLYQTIRTNRGAF